MKETFEIVKRVKEILDEKKGEDIDVLDISGVSVIADYFVVASAASLNQLNAMKDDLEEKLYKEFEMNPKDVEGSRGSTWILLDYGDFIVHLFTREDRAFYDLERIWKDGKKVEI